MLDERGASAVAAAPLSSWLSNSVRTCSSDRRDRRSRVCSGVRFCGSSIGVPASAGGAGALAAGATGDLAQPAEAATQISRATMPVAKVNSRRIVRGLRAGMVAISAVPDPEEYD